MPVVGSSNTGRLKHAFELEVIDQLMHRRVKLKMSQADLAKKVGMHKRTLSNLENGRQRLKISQMYDLAVALDIIPACLIQHACNQMIYHTKGSPLYKQKHHEEKAQPSKKSA